MVGSEDLSKCRVSGCAPKLALSKMMLNEEIIKMDKSDLEMGMYETTVGNAARLGIESLNHDLCQHPEKCPYAIERGYFKR